MKVRLEHKIGLSLGHKYKFFTLISTGAFCLLSDYVINTLQIWGHIIDMRCPKYLPHVKEHGEGIAFNVIENIY